jgi:glycosyltransferase involved in cell wall biosynthesis
MAVADTDDAATQGSLPTVSVIIPSYNAARFLRDSIHSVLNQTWQDLECIVVDDGSTDSTADVVSAIKDLRLRYHYKQNEKTPSATRNVGVSVSRGEFVAFLDADDVWLPTKLESQMRLLQAKPDLGLVFCAYAITDPELQPLTVIYPEHREDLFLRTLLAEGNGIAAGSTALVPREVFAQCGGFEIELSVSEDTDFAERVARAFPADGVDECLVLYRTHPGQNHLRIDAFEHDALWILEDRFGLDPARKALLHRGLANLHTRLFFYRLQAGELRAAGRHFRQALRIGPYRLIRLPLEGMARRAARRSRSAAFRVRQASHAQAH